jgi:hypothetical protein
MPNDEDACGCRYPIESAVVGTCSVLEFRVKTFDLDLGDGGAVHRYLLEGVIMEFYPPWSRSSVKGGKFWFFLYFFYLSMICCVRDSSHQQSHRFT